MNLSTGQKINGEVVSSEEQFLFAVAENHNFVANFKYIIILGDANDDCLVNIFDVQKLIAYLLYLNSHPFNAINADVNEDGHINMADV